MLFASRLHLELLKNVRSDCGKPIPAHSSVKDRGVRVEGLPNWPVNSAELRDTTRDRDTGRMATAAGMLLARSQHGTRGRWGGGAEPGAPAGCV